MIYVVTGKLGAGKTLLAVQRAIDYALEGRRVAANFHIDFAPACRTPGSAISKAAVNVIPAIPSLKDLEMLGNGGDFEDRAGGLFLDECAQFLNSRDYRNPDREGVINWLLHARKRCWDVFLIIQHERMLDKQIRDALAEYVVVVRRTDRLSIPFIPVKLPRLHVGTVRYGLEANALVADRWFTRGAEPMKCYDTRAIFGSDTNPYTSLPAVYTKFRNQPVKKVPSMRQLLITAILVAAVAFPAGHHFWPQSKPVANAVVASVAPVSDVPDFDKSVQVKTVMWVDSGFTLILTDGHVVTGTDYKIMQEGQFYMANQKWYRKA